MTLLERIAAVLERARLDGGWDDEAVAFKVLREMHEPTDAMLDTSGYQDAGDVWRSFINAALNEAPAHTSSEIGHG